MSLAGLMQAFCFLVFLVASVLPFFSAEASLKREYQITAEGSHLGTLQKVKNCVDYHFCDVVPFLIAGGNPEFRLHLFGIMNSRDLAGYEKTRVWTLFPVKGKKSTPASGEILARVSLKGRIPTSPSAICLKFLELSTGDCVCDGKQPSWHDPCFMGKCR